MPTLPRMNLAPVSTGTTTHYVINQYYPKPEKSESIARTVRSLAYLRKGTDRR